LTALPAIALSSSILDDDSLAEEIDSLIEGNNPLDKTNLIAGKYILNDDSLALEADLFWRFFLLRIFR